jgi:DNA-binding response OmpR family regulator
MAIIMSLPFKARILVAEDDPAMLDLVSRWLETAGYAVVKVRDGEEAVQTIGEEPLSAIVMDLTMPRMDGFQVLAQLRALRRPLPPVILLTGRLGADDVRKALSLGARDYLAKPVDRAHLLARLERVLRAAQPLPGAGPLKTSGRPAHYVD